MKVLTPQEIYAVHLKVVNGIPFTRREIDILSCVLNGRTAKRIASFLSIAPKTVENHIRNLMLKIGCQSQERIRDFVEKSGKFIYVKKHYSSLLIQSSFELQLNNICKSFIKNKATCLVIHDNQQKENIYALTQIQRHLNFVGIKVTMEVKNGYQSPKDLFDTLETQQVNYIIYCFPKVALDQLIEEQEKINHEIHEKIPPKNSHPNSIVTIFMKKTDFLVNVSENSLYSNYVCLEDQQNYYLFFFKIIKVFFPNLYLEKIILEFKQKCSTLEDPSSSKDKVDNRGVHFKKNKINFKRKRNIVTLCLGIIFVFIFFYSSKKVINKKNEERLITQLPSPDLDLQNSFRVSTKNGKIISWNLPRQDHAFIGREELLRQLDQSLPTNEKMDCVKRERISVFTGLGGVGKTQLALRYIHHSKHPYTLRVWFEAENLEQLKHQYVELSKTLGCKEENPTIKLALFYIKEWLTKNPGWLLIYDNVNSYEEIKEFFPENSGSIILTSRQQNWPSGFTILDVDVMNEEESIKLVQSLIKRKITESEERHLKKLVNILGYLPLALAQAGAYICQNHISIAEYLEFYNNHEQRLLADNTLPEGIANLPVAITWNISLKAVVKDSKEINQAPIALDLLNACAYLAPEKIPRGFLMAWLKKKYPNLLDVDLELLKLIRQLSNYSLIHADENGNITIHRLVQTVIRYQHKQVIDKISLDYPPLSLDWYSILLESAHSEFNRNSRIIEDERRKKEWLPHLQALLSHGKQIWKNTSQLIASHIVNDIGTAFFLMGEMKSAKLYFQNALGIVEHHLGKNHVEVAYTLDQLGRAYRYLGDAREALAVHERALEIKEKYYGKDHIEIANTLDQLGRAHRYLGDAKESKRVHERALVIKEKHFGKNHIEVANTLDELGRDYRSLGDPLGAKEVHARAVTVKEQYYGKDHIEVSHSLNELARAYRNLGDSRLAKVMHEQILKIKKRYYGEAHYEVAYTMNELGNDYRDLGDIKLAMQHHVHALEIREKYYGINHVEAAYTLDELGSDYRSLKSYETSKEYLERALRIKQQYYGENHPETARTLTNLGCVYTYLNKVSTARSYLEKALSIRENYYGLENPFVAETLMELSNLCNVLKNTEEAKLHIKRALKIREQYFAQKNHLSDK